MNIFTIALANARYHFWRNLFNVLILALGVALIITLLHVSRQVQERFSNDLEGIDLVVSAKGSPLQVILSSVFHMDIPTGNISLADAKKLEANPLIRASIPLSLGDNFRGFHIVGTTADYPKHYHATMAQGDYWTAPMQTVLGSDVAATTHLAVGDTFVGSHGLTAGGEEHSQFPYKVTGILAPTNTVADRLIFTDLASVWNVHEHHDADDHDEDDDDDAATLGKPKAREITALLITYKSPLAAATLPRMINKKTSMQAASPAAEMARLYSQLGIGGNVLEMFGGILIAIAAISFMLTLFNAVNERSYEIALIRGLGATRRKIFGLLLTEGISLAVIGIALGASLAQLAMVLLQGAIEKSRHILLPPVRFDTQEGLVMLIALGISFLAVIIPAFLAYRVNVAKILAKGV